ncbi:hypothetical protein D3C75_1003530 [compost metagenome]
MIAARDPVRQAPVFGQCLAQAEQPYPEQLHFYLRRRFALVHHAQFPVFEQLGKGQGQWP